MGEELKRLSKSGILQSDKLPSKVAMIFDWNNYWANAELNATSRNYINKLLAYYQAIARQHVNIDLVAPTADLSQYKLVVAPFMYMVTKQDRENLKRYVQQGGILLTGAFSGMVNENDNVYLGGYPGGLRKLTGIWIEELDHLDQGKHIPVRMADGVVQGGGLDEVIHLENAKAVAVYEGKYYAGTPAVTVNDFGQGKVFHVGTYLDQNGLQAVIRNAFSAAGITGHALQAAATVDCTVRQNDQTRYYFFVNTTPAGQVVANPVPGAQDLLSEEKTGKQINLGGYGVAILAVER
ncbi:beta-galactosidase trimerization domain-containing protein [Limosilactobacillus secaliphilus]